MSRPWPEQSIANTFSPLNESMGFKKFILREELLLD